jgi:hypothetical protein
MQADFQDGRWRAGQGASPDHSAARKRQDSGLIARSREIFRGLPTLHRKRGSGARSRPFDRRRAGSSEGGQLTR